MPHLQCEVLLNVALFIIIVTCLISVLREGGVLWSVEGGVVLWSVEGGVVLWTVEGGVVLWSVERRGCVVVS